MAESALIKIGEEGHPLLMVDQAHPAPRDLVEAAAESFFVRAGAVYPGIRAPVPQDYQDNFARDIAPRIEDTFGQKVETGIDKCSFSIVTVPAGRLALNQQVPHTDSNDPNVFAFVHYLCREDHGGTLFFKHKPTGYERIDESRAEHYNSEVGRLLRKMAECGTGGAFAAASKDYEIVYSAENVFNRMIVYSGANLHSGDIRLPAELSSNPRRGRLTVTGFLKLR